ncbi:MAG: carboxypeptidase M32 [Chloroflexi bacterium]|nr:carboxypeptidase M32 [Chloroflexota bacterium]
MAGWNELLDQLHELADLGAATAILDWDQQTKMPPKGAEARAHQLATLQGIHHERLTSAALRDALEGAETAGDGPAPFRGEAGQALLRETRRIVERGSKLPVPFVKELASASSRAFERWQRARAESRFIIFRDDLARLVDLKRREARYVGYREHPYDALLDEFEPGQTATATAAVFQEIRGPIVALLRAIQASPRQPRREILTQHFPSDNQWAFGLEVLSTMGFDFEAGRQDTSAHPFTTGFSPGDVRVTTRVYENELPVALFGTIHEGGHALYEQGFAPELMRTPLANSPSLGMHESQSRLWENVIGRSSAFWRYWYPRLSARFPEQLSRIPEEDFVLAINHVRPSFIRVEADEVTYNLHIILRFELEVALLEGSLEVDALPEVWNAKMDELFGIVPERDADGVLQDVHWSYGSFGYFPTYTLGTLYSTQLWMALKRVFPDFEDRIARGDVLFIREWLRENIHRHGSTFVAQELLQRVTGEGLNPTHFLGYLRQKFSALYQLVW